MAATTKLTVANEILRELGVKNPLTQAELDTPAEPRSREINNAFDHAVEFLLGELNWTFARRRQAITGAASTAYPGYAFVYTKPNDWLRTIWIKESVTDFNDLDYAEVGAVIYGHVTPAVIDYMSDDADNYDPANWPPQFTRTAILYLAYLLAPGLARAGDDVQSKLWTQYTTQIDNAAEFEARHLVNEQVAGERLPVMRRALEIMTQALGKTAPIHNQNARLMWHMQKCWEPTLKYVLEQGAWNFASRRARLTGGSETVPGQDYDDVIEGYTTAPATETTDTDLPAISEFDYGFALPDDFLHLLWCKSDANMIYSTDYQVLGRKIFSRVDTLILEYIAYDTDSIDPTYWSQTFVEAVAARLAYQVHPEIMVEGKGAANRERISVKGARDNLLREWDRALADAKRKDAIQQQAKPAPLGTFARARLGSRYGMGRR